MKRHLILLYFVFLCFQSAWAQQLKVTHFVSMSYPGEATKTFQKQRRADFRLKISSDGEIKEMKSRGPEIFAKAASENLSDWRFAQTEKGMKVKVKFVFILGNGPGWSYDDNGKNLTITVRGVRP